MLTIDCNPLEEKNNNNKKLHLKKQYDLTWSLLGL